MLWERDSVPEEDRSMGMKPKSAWHDSGYLVHSDAEIWGGSVFQIGMRKNESDPTENTLAHYGVKGQKWGVITKGYEKVGYNYARKIRYPNQQVMRQRGEDLGRRMFKKTYERHAPQEEAPKKPDAVDRVTKKVADHFGLGAYSKMASDFLKEQATNSAMNYVLKNKGKVVTLNGTKAIGKILSKPLGLAGKGVLSVGHLAEKTVLKAPKYIAKGSWFIGKTMARVGTKTAKWLHRGGAKKIKRGQTWLSTQLRNLGKMSASWLKNNTRDATMMAKRAAMRSSRTAAAITRNGARTLTALLKKIRR